MAGFLVLAVATVVALRLGGLDQSRWPRAWWYVAQWSAFLLAAVAVRRVGSRHAVWLIVAGGALLQLLAVLWPPRTTDDFYRYIWDGRVQAHGIDPYRYAPIDPALAGLRDPWLFPGPGDHTVINHRSVPTIYPPVAQLFFLLVHLLPGERNLPLQLATALVAVATSLLLVLATGRMGVDRRSVVWWAWCPTVVLEAGNDAHVDTLGAFFLAAGMLALAGPALAGPALRRRRAWLAGALLGAAVGVKFLPGLVAPALARHRRRWALLGGAVVVLALTYTPHVLAVGPRVFGFLPGYLAEERFDGSDRYPLLGLLLPGAAAAVAGVVVIAVTALLVWWRGDPARPARGAVVMTGVTFCVLSPEYSWYALVLVVLVVLADRPEWLAVVAAGWPAYLVGSLHLPIVGTRAVSYGSAAAVVAVVSWWRYRRRTAGAGSTAAPLQRRMAPGSP